MSVLVIRWAQTDEGPSASDRGLGRGLGRGLVDKGLDMGVPGFGVPRAHHMHAVDEDVARVQNGRARRSEVVKNMPL